MLSIYETVSRTLEKYKNENEDFHKGVKTVMGLFEIGIRKSTQFNLALKVRELEKQLNKQKTVIENQRKEINLKANKIFELSLISGQPTKEFRTFEIPIGETKEIIEIVTNMDVEMMQTCLYNFHKRHKFKRYDEAKSKLLMFINSKNHLGFFAYKSEKVFKKEHLNKRK